MIKKIISICLTVILLLSVSGSIFALPGNGITVDLVQYGNEKITVSGTATCAAIVVEVWKPDGKMMAFVSKDVTNGQYTVEITAGTLSYGLYSFKVANYKGGTYTVAKYTLGTDPAATPSPTPTPSPAGNSTDQTSATPTPTPSATPTPTPSLPPKIPGDADIPTMTAPKPSVDNQGTALVTVGEQLIRDLVGKTAAGTNGIKTVGLIVPEIAGAKSYKSVLPASSFNASTLTQKIEVRTAIGSVTVPGNMLSNTRVGSSADVALSIASVDKNKLPADIKKEIGDRPVIELSVSSSGKYISYNNPDAPVVVSIPYTPTASELKDPEHIVVWYIDGTGKAIPVPDARFDSGTGKVVFTTYHFSMYAVSSVYITFTDLAGYSWAKNPVEVLASKGIVTGVAEKTFLPGGKITKGQYTDWLVKSFNLTAAFTEGFKDVKPTDSYYSSVGIAKKLGIARGDGSGKLNPEVSLSRQEMFVMAARAMKVVGKMPKAGNSTDLNAFKDKTSVASYAVNDIAALVKNGVIKGSSSALNPRSLASRVEAATFLYRLYNLK